MINQQSFPDLRDKRDEPISKLEEKHVQDTEPLQDKENQEQDDKHYDNVYNSQEDLPLNIVGQSQHVMSIKRIIVDKAKVVAEERGARLDTEYKKVIIPRHEDDSPEDAKDTTYGKIKDHKCELCHFKTNRFRFRFITIYFDDNRCRAQTRHKHLLRLCHDGMKYITP